MQEDIKYLTADADYPFVVEMAGISYCDSSYRVSRQCSEITVLEYVIRGAGVVIEEEQKFHAGQGDVYILHQNRRHTYFADPKAPWQKIWFNIRGPVVSQLLQAYQLDQVNLVQNCPAEIHNLFSRFLQITKENKSLESRFDSCALVYHDIVQQLSQLKPAKKGISDEAVLLRDYIRQHLGQTIMLDDLARQIYRSKAYTIKAFRRAFGQTPYAYACQCRIDAACRLLTETQLPIKAISQQLCFADQHYFATVFRRAKGLSPRAYRRQPADFPSEKS